jgi:hypothetical protein
MSRLLDVRSSWADAFLDVSDEGSAEGNEVSGSFSLHAAGDATGV